MAKIKEKIEWSKEELKDKIKRGDLDFLDSNKINKNLDYFEKYELEELEQLILKAFETLYTSNPLSKRLKELNVIFWYIRTVNS